MERNITKVKILGAEYQISCPPEESKQVKEAAIFFDKRLKEIKQKSKSDIKKLTSDIKKHLESISKFDN